MPQKIFTKQFGEVVFKRSWATTTMHIGELLDGGYAHLPGGLPVKSRAELEACIPHGDELEAAVNWFEHRNDPVEDTPQKRLVLQPDGSYLFDDGSKVTSISDLVNHIRPGLALDAAVQWFSEKKRQEDTIKAAAEKEKNNPFARAAAKVVKPEVAAMPDDTGEVEIVD